MSKKTTTTVNKNQNGQYQTTIPKPLAEAMKLEGKKITWKVESSNSLKFKIENNQN